MNVYSLFNCDFILLTSRTLLRAHLFDWCWIPTNTKQFLQVPLEGNNYLAVTLPNQILRKQGFHLPFHLISFTPHLFSTPLPEPILLWTSMNSIYSPKNLLGHVHTRAFPKKWNFYSRSIRLFLVWWRTSLQGKLKILNESSSLERKADIEKEVALHKQALQLDN